MTTMAENAFEGNLYLEELIEGDFFHHMNFRHTNTNFNETC